MNRLGDDIRIGRFAGFDLFLRSGLSVEMVLRGKNSYNTRVTDSALGTIRSLEFSVQGFEERIAKLEASIVEDRKRAGELEPKVGMAFEHEERHQRLSRRQNEIGQQLDLTKNQPPSQAETVLTEDNEQVEKQTKTPRQNRRVAMCV
jgi:hypothetical protein